MNRKELLPAIEKGQVSTATIDDKVRRILRTAVRFGWLDREQTDYSIPRYNQAGRQVALECSPREPRVVEERGKLVAVSKSKNEVSACSRSRCLSGRSRWRR